MQRPLLLFVLIFGIHAANAQDHFRTGLSLSVGEGKLIPPYGDAFTPALNANGQLNYINGFLIADAGFGAAVITDKYVSYFGTDAETELFLEIPVGVGLYLNVGGGAHLILGGNFSLLYNAGGTGTYYDAGPHVDLLWTSRGGNENGFFVKGLYNVAGADKYSPRYLGIGFRTIFGDPPGRKKGAKRHH